MKNLYRSLCAGLLLLLSAGCTKEFLEKEPIGRVGKEILLQDMDGARAALAGAYNRMAYYYSREFLMYPDIASDDVRLKVTGNSSDGQLILFNEHNFQSNPEDDELAVGHIWLNIFEALDNVNSLLNAIPQLKTLEPSYVQELESIQGQALIMRALCHYDLSRVYAQHYTFTSDAQHWGVPILLKTPGPDVQVRRATMKDTYAQVIKDLQEGAALLEGSPVLNQYKASHYSAWALLSRVYLYMEDWQNAQVYADKVIEASRYTLTDSAGYKAMYLEQQPASEVIWQLYSRDYSASTVAAVYSTPSFRAYASDQLWALYDTTDVRRAVYGESGGRHYSLKYGKAEDLQEDEWPVDPKVVRLSEVLLNRAEAAWHLGQYEAALADLQRIRQRAMPSAAAPGELTAEQLYLALKVERRKELAFEGHRLFDLTRRREDLVRGEDCGAAVCFLEYPSVRFILPIPSLELDANKAMQPNPVIN
ncbi:RagB/SusD family nutrient uptake outer membrane protein [Pontibacter mangrovi]|uniref:RagB/SusD family nutrient uptake outer membrane protein n=1 Tax=Pontibacter mangrovi TaxID=2589816 RepID=A0A501W0Y2_9BACT|nr:RagB/SusD family nutrient uptake outer membrane protein [Pontibacter mangrovi]TPE42372.1 RagB/SusD family nutrient uptake outer membrane protein [Pontibacter mangrovi]